MATRESEYFHSLPPFTVARAEALVAGQALPLLLLEYVPTGGGVIFPLSYIHRELVFRTPGRKDAVAFGTARFFYQDDFTEVRILFSQLRETAALRGLSMEGNVKIGSADQFT